MECSTKRSIKAASGRAPKLGEWHGFAMSHQPPCQFVGVVVTEGALRSGVVRCRAVLSAAVNAPVLSGNGLVAGKVHAAVLASQHGLRPSVAGHGLACALGRVIGFSCRDPVALPKPNASEDGQQKNKQFQRDRPKITSSTKREPA